jgi:hypothetical protein
MKTLVHFTGWEVLTVPLFQNEMRDKITGLFSIPFFMLAFTHACSLERCFSRKTNS